jgi:hypothetical protein
MQHLQVGALVHASRERDGLGLTMEHLQVGALVHASREREALVVTI